MIEKNEKSERFEMRMDQDTIEYIDEWRKQNSNLSRAEAIRRLIVKGVHSEFSDGEKLIMHMLCDIYKHLKINGDIDPEFIESALAGGHYWALKWEYTGIFHDHFDDKKALEDVVNILDMWFFIESGYNGLSSKEKKLIEKEAAPFGTHVKFIGFDGNNESEYMGIAKFLVEKMDRFQLFKGRNFNSHMPILSAYKRMFSVFEPMRTTLYGRELSSSEIIKILKAMAR
jgi:uncharacterized protein